MKRYPLKMQPAFKDYLWGGTRLKEEYKKQTDKKIVAESWEISCHPDGPSTIENGPLAGQSLAAVLQKYPQMMGNAYQENEEFPLLIKLIDAKQALSLQVHPEDAYARQHEGQQGKNEMWYVMEAQPGSSLLLGLEKAVPANEMEERIANDTLSEILCAIPVQAGDCFCVPAGMLHAIGAGVMIAEIQQNSNVTYRVYDYGRRDAQGNLRELHVKKALDVINPELKAENSATAAPVQKDGYRETPLANWQYFSAGILEIEEQASLTVSENTFTCLLVTQGAFTLKSGDTSLSLQKGESVFLPAGLGGYSLAGSGKVLTTSMP